uniref:Ferredoxin n=1 Tax=Streptomyces versipellis TaxID=67375 RepID=A0A0B6VLQ3_9ACTN|nr:putative ferredoxin [Streptomyces versipellis]
MTVPVVRIHIDTDVCVGAGQCTLVAPGVFRQHDEGHSTLVPGADGSGSGSGSGSPLVREAARACPVGAITVTSSEAPAPDGAGGGRA